MTDILLIVFASISVFMASLFSTVTGFGFALVAVPFWVRMKRLCL